jgi:hypothetical protein
MRATINFEVDVDQVENTMATVVAMEADTLRAIADMIDVNPGPRTMVLEEVTEALRLLSEVRVQLQQYHDMLGSFRQAKFETMLPQSSDVRVPVRGQPVKSAGEVQEAVESMKNLEGFLQKINYQEESTHEAEEG